MSSTSSESELRRALAARTGTRPEEWRVVFKARQGMQVVFEALRSCRGEGSVVTQLFTCLTAVTPILAAGLRPAYADVSPDTASLDPSRLELPSDARALVVQHTYGIVDDERASQLAARAHAAGALVVEDSALCVGRLARTADGAPLADVSVHSFGVEKVLSSCFGGAVWVNPNGFAPDVAAAIARALEALPPAGARLDLLTRVYRYENAALVHLPAGLSHALRSALVACRLIELPVSEAERRGRADQAPRRATEWVCARVLSELAGLDEAERVRRETVEAYRAELAGVDGLQALAGANSTPAQPLLRYPVLAPDSETADEMVRQVCETGYYAQAWYRPELGPGVLDPEAFLVPEDRSRLSVHERLVAGCVALPADIGAEGARRVVATLRAVLAERQAGR